MVNVLDNLPKKLQSQAKRYLQDIVYSEARETAEVGRDSFARWSRLGQKAAGVPEKHWFGTGIAW